MSRIIRSIAEENPLYAVCDQLASQLPTLLGSHDLFSPSEDGVSYTQYAKYLIFESIAEHIRQKQRAEDSRPLHAYIRDSYEESEGAGASIVAEEALKKVSKDLGLRMEFLSAKLKRHKLSNVPDILADYEKMKTRGNRRYGYHFTPIQYQQLTDRDDFYIKKVHELRRFRNAKHAPKEDVIRYYNSLFEHAKKCRNSQSVKERVISAINLNDFENENLSLLLYCIARYCFEHNITTIAKGSENRLGILSGSLSYSNDGYRLLSTHKPILLLNHYIPAAFDCSAAKINQYIFLRLCGPMIRKSVLPNMLDKLNYSYKYIDQFICAPYGWDFYNIYSYYSIPNLAESNSIWDDRGKIIAILRELINKLTINPLSTE